MLPRFLSNQGSRCLLISFDIFSFLFRSPPSSNSYTCYTDKNLTLKFSTAHRCEKLNVHIGKACRHTDRRAGSEAQVPLGRHTQTLRNGTMTSEHSCSCFCGGSIDDCYSSDQTKRHLAPHCHLLARAHLGQKAPEMQDLPWALSWNSNYDACLLTYCFTLSQSRVIKNQLPSSNLL